MVVDHGAGLPGKPGNYRIAKFPGTWARTTGAHCKGLFFEMGDYMGFNCSLGQGNSQYVMGRKCDQIGSCHPEKNRGASGSSTANSTCRKFTDPQVQSASSSRRISRRRSRIRLGTPPPSCFLKRSKAFFGRLPPGSWIAVKATQAKLQYILRANGR